MAEPDGSRAGDTRSRGSSAVGGIGSPGGRWRRLARSISALTGTTAFKQAATTVAGVVAAAAIVMWLLYGSVTGQLARSAIEAMTADADGLADVAHAAGPGALITAITERLRSDPSRLYFVEAAGGARLAGNLDRWPAELPAGAGGGTFHITPASDAKRDGGNGRTGAPGAGYERLAAGVVRDLDGDLRLLVARDIAGETRIASHIEWLFLAGFAALALVGLVVGLLSSRLALQRVAKITRTSEQIMAGDFSGRIELTPADDEFDHLSSNLNAMLDKVEQLMSGLREVSDNIAHDLKTPLSRLRTRAEAALRDDADPARQREALAQVIEDADGLIKTFNAMLLIARLETGTLADTAETFDLGALVRDVAELYQPVAEEAGLVLDCTAQGGVLVRANRQLVGQALANLIDNAVKYGTPPPMQSPQQPRGHGTIEVRLDRLDGEARLSVADQGPGIAVADRERVLRRFVRLDQSRSRPGTGLGLSLVAAVARLQGGRITLEDNAPGLKVVLVLPHATCPVPAPARSIRVDRNRLD